MSRADGLRGASTLLLLVVVGLSIDAVFWEVVYGRAPALHVVGIAMAALLFVLLKLPRLRPRAWIGAMALLLVMAVVVAALWVAGGALARAPRAWVPFQSQKLAVLAIALLAPSPTWIGAVIIAAFTAASACQFVAFPPDVRAHLAAGEPWATVAVGVFALALLVDRVRRIDCEREAARAHAEARSAHRIARLCLAVRDLSNTPLFTLRLSAALLRARHPEEATTLAHMERALARLEALNRALARYEEQIDWHPGAESFDALAVIEEREDSEPAPPPKAPEPAAPRAPRPS